MIRPHDGGVKPSRRTQSDQRAAGRTERAGGFTKSLNRRTKTPHFGQSPVTLDSDKASVASWPGSVRTSDSSAPQPPGGQPAGSVEFRVRFNPQNASGRLSRRPIFFPPTASG